MIHPDTCLRFVNDRFGYGVFATRLIPRGTVVWVQDELDQVLSPARVEALPAALRKQVDRYGYLDGAGNEVLCWDHARYMNHSCDPTSTSIGTMLEIARRDVQPGDELTCEYGLAYIVENFACTCGAASCRGGPAPTGLDDTWKRWDREGKEAFAWALSVDQPVLAAARAAGPGAWITQAIVERRSIELPSWADGVPGGA